MAKTEGHLGGTLMIAERKQFHEMMPIRGRRRLSVPNDGHDGAQATSSLNHDCYSITYALQIRGFVSEARKLDMENKASRPDIDDELDLDITSNRRSQIKIQPSVSPVLRDSQEFRLRARVLK